MQAQAAYGPTPYPFLASLASFFLDDDVDGGAPIRCQRLRPEQCDDEDVMMMV